MSCSTIRKVRPAPLSARISSREPAQQRRVDAGRRLVEQDHRRVEHQHLGQLDELALPVGQVGGPGVDVVAHADELQELGRPRGLARRTPRCGEQRRRLEVARSTAATFSSTVRLSKSRGSW